MTSIPCPVPNCSKDVLRGGYCYSHYMKNWRYGTPTPKHEPKWQDIRGKRFGELVVTGVREGRFWICQCDCGATTKADAGNLNRGTKKSCGNSKLHHRSSDAGYTAAHQRVARDRGVASGHQCADCGEPALHWSYNHTDPGEALSYSISSSPVAYSLNPEHYSPRCVPCHKRFDLDKANALSCL